MPVPNNLSQFDLGWLVGLFEGEGSIIFSRSHRGKRSYLMTQVTITNTNIRLLNRAKNLCGYGKIFIHNLGNDKHRPAWTWRLTNQPDIACFLEMVLPHLIEKRDKAECMFAYCKLRMGRSFRNAKYTEKEKSYFKSWRLHAISK